MLTIKEINEVSFGKAGFSGYKPEDVDNFIDEVAAAFQQMQAEKDDLSKKAAELTAKNSELQEKLSILAEKIEMYRRDEDGIKDALITAQVTARASVKDAQKKAGMILDNAEHQAQATLSDAETKSKSMLAESEMKSKVMLSDAEKESRELIDHARSEAAQAAQHYASQIEDKKNELEEVKRQVTAFRSSLLEMYKKHLDCIDHIPSFRHKEPENTAVTEPEAVSAEPEHVKQPAEPSAPVPSVSARPAPVQENTVQTAVREPAQKQEAPAQPAREPARKPEAPAKPEPSEARSPALEKNHARQAAPNPMNQRVNYAQPHRRETEPFPEIPGLVYSEDSDLTDVGIDTTTFNSIPESLLKEKKAGYTHLEFGDGFDVTPRK